MLAYESSLWPGPADSSPAAVIRWWLLSPGTALCSTCRLCGTWASGTAGIRTPNAGLIAFVRRRVFAAMPGYATVPLWWMKPPGVLNPLVPMGSVTVGPRCR